MSESIIVSGATKAEKYQSLLPQLEALVANEDDRIANLANLVAALKHGFDFFWIGIYFVKETKENRRELVLGPFQGPVACTRIAYSKGVCGKSWETKQTIMVDDVDAFPGHIACSSQSKSEIVIPAFNKLGEVELVLDVDSEYLANFDEVDKKYLEEVITIIENL